MLIIRANTFPCAELSSKGLNSIFTTPYVSFCYIPNIQMRKLGHKEFKAHGLYVCGTHSHSHTPNK